MEALEALNTALKREIDGQKFYQDAASKTTDPKGRKLFEWLSREESGHIKLLESAIAELQENAQWLTMNTWGPSDYITEPIDASEYPSKPQVMGDLPADAPELAIITKAIEAENADADFYDIIARSVEDPEGRILIEKLAHIEKGHADLLEQEQYWIKHSKDLFTLHRFLPAG